MRIGAACGFMFYKLLPTCVEHTTVLATMLFPWYEEAKSSDLQVAWFGKRDTGTSLRVDCRSVPVSGLLISSPWSSGFSSRKHRILNLHVIRRDGTRNRKTVTACGASQTTVGWHTWNLQASVSSCPTPDKLCLLLHVESLCREA
jgi:hypothetical protein